MKTRVLRTDVPRPREMIAKRIWLTVGGPRGISFQTKTVLISTPPSLAEMLTEVEDGTSEVDVREAIQAAALADDWKLANEIITRYEISACLRCAANVSNRPTWRLFWIEKVRYPLPCRQPKHENENWGEICGTCAIWMMENYL